MRYFLILTLSLYSILAQAQINGLVKDSLTGKPIPYVNIWVDGQMVGTSSLENGSFSLSYQEAGKLVFSSIGYHSKTLNINDSKEVVLSPNIIILEEVSVKRKESPKKALLSDLPSKKTRSSFGNGKVPFIIARSYQFQPSISETPFIDKIEFYSQSPINGAKILVRILKMDENGRPGEDILPNGLIVKVKKGRELNVIDLSKNDIYFPSSGLLVAFEWIIIPENQYEFTYTINGSKERHKGVRNAPSIGCYPFDVDNGTETWIYRQGKWFKEEMINHYTDIILKLQLSE